jgi:hypothetical protein
MRQYPEWLDSYSAMDYPSQPPFETFINYQSLFIQYQTDIWDVREEYLLSNIDYQYETSFA